MKVLIITPIVFNEQSPFNHIFKSILEGFLESSFNIIRYVAVEKEDEIGYRLGIRRGNIQYKVFKRRKCRKSNFLHRFASDCWMNFRMALRIFNAKGIDVLFEDTSYSSIFPVIFAKMKRIKVVMMVQDVWPDNAVMSGMLSGKGLLYRVFNSIQNTLYKRADRIIVISDDMKEFLISKGINGDKIGVIYNWPYTDGVVDIPWEDNQFVKKFNLSKDIFYAVYAGNIGKMQNVEIVVEAAKLLVGNDRMRFLIVGDGVRREAIEAKVQECGLNNVTMFPMQSSDMALHIYSMAGVNLIPLVKGGIKTALPSKTPICLACGKPVLAVVGKNTMFADMINAAGFGTSVDSDDSEGLVEKLHELLVNEKNWSLKKAHDIFYKVFGKKSNVAKYVGFIQEVNTSAR